jgi:hypothetical protein
MSRAAKPKPTKIRAKEFDALNVVAWRAGFVLLRQAGNYAVINKPNLRTWMRRNVNVKAAVKAAPRLFRTSDGAKLRRWLADKIAEQEQEARP